MWREVIIGSFCSIVFYMSLLFRNGDLWKAFNIFDSHSAHLLTEGDSTFFTRFILGTNGIIF